MPNGQILHWIYVLPENGMKQQTWFKPFNQLGYMRVEIRQPAQEKYNFGSLIIIITFFKLKEFYWQIALR